MQIKSKFIEGLAIQRGSSNNKEWTKQDFIIETLGEYPKKVCLQLFNKTDIIHNLKNGDEIEVFFNAESREYNGKWYTNLSAYKVECKKVETSSPNSGDLSY